MRVRLLVSGPLEPRRWRLGLWLSRDRGVLWLDVAVVLWRVLVEVGR